MAAPNRLQADMKTNTINRVSSMAVAAAAAGSLVQAASGWWDVFSHRLEFTTSDPWWNPAHLGLYAGTLMLLLGSFAADSKQLHMMRVVKIGVFMQLVGGGLNEAAHNLLFSETLDLVAHGLFTLGMLVAAFSLFSGVALMARSVLHQSLLLELSQGVAGVSFWLTASGSALYVLGFTPAIVLAFLAFIASMVIIMGLESARFSGFATINWILYSAIVFIILVGYVHVEPYLPLGIFALVLLELMHRLLKRFQGNIRYKVLSGLMIGFLTTIIYYPLTDRYLERLLVSMDLTISAVLGGISGSLLVAYAAKVWPENQGFVNSSGSRRIGSSVGVQQVNRATLGPQSTFRHTFSPLHRWKYEKGYQVCLQSVEDNNLD
ncbi:MAG: hypothetical protein HY619_02260 [Thaumarchaeota archaeon]|nr:hypothetical protein [Nitrososphaerota archaeon]